MEDKDKICIVNVGKSIIDRTNSRDQKRVSRQPLIPKYRIREFEEDKEIRKFSSDMVKLAVRHPTPEAKGSVVGEFR